MPLSSDAGSDTGSSYKLRRIATPPSPPSSFVDGFRVPNNHSLRAYREASEACRRAREQHDAVKRQCRRMRHTVERLQASIDTLTQSKQAIDNTLDEKFSYFTQNFAVIQMCVSATTCRSRPLFVYTTLNCFAIVGHRLLLSKVRHTLAYCVEKGAMIREEAYMQS